MGRSQTFAFFPLWKPFPACRFRLPASHLRDIDFDKEPSGSLQSALNPPVFSLESPDPLIFESLAAFRYQLRRFLRFSKDLLRAEELTPDQYQALLAIRVSPR